MNIYLAGKWDDKEKILEKMYYLESNGFKITHRWPNFETETSLNSVAAEQDTLGVLASDVLVVIMDDNQYNYRGTFTEIGIALGSKKRIIIFCPDEKSFCTTNIFFHHPKIEHTSTWNKTVELLSSK